MQLTTPEDTLDDDEGSVTRVIRRMQSGDPDGAPLLWQRFYSRLRVQVKERLSSPSRTLADEEDVAVDSLAELFQGLLAGKYPALENRESLWKLLVTVASRNVIDEINKERRLKRGSGRVYNESGMCREGEEADVLSQVPSKEPSPEVKMMIAERCTQMLGALEDEQLQTIALLKTAGSTNQEVATKLNISVRSVERRLMEIRERWASKISSP